MEKKVYGYYFRAVDEDGVSEEELIDLTSNQMEPKDIAQQLVNEFSQNNESFIDQFGIVHEVYEGVDQPFVFLFTVTDDDWSEVTRTVGELLNNREMGADVRQCLSKVYECALAKC